MMMYSCTQPPPDRILRFGIPTSPNNFDPRFATDAISTRLNRLFYSRLVDFGAQSLPSPSLASWKVLSPTHYRFTLTSTPPIFTNGQQLTVQDIKATFDSILDPENVSPHRGTLQVIAQVTISGENTIDFFLRHADRLFPGYLVIGILPANLITQQHPFNEFPIGSGHFEFVERRDETRVRIRRRSDGQLIEFQKIPDPTVRSLKLLAGEIHLLQNDLPPELVSYLSEQDGISVQHYQGSNISYLGFNQLDPVVGRLPVRKAIAHALDRSAIIQFVLRGRARLAQGLFPPDHWAGLTGLPEYAYDPGLAKRYLQEAGFNPTHKPHIIYKTSTDPFRLRLATIIQAQLQQVGFDVEIQSHDWGTFYGDVKKGNFQMYSLAWVGLKTPDIFRYAFHSHSHPPQGANRGRYSNQRVDRLIQQGELASDFSSQQTIYQTLQTHLHETLPYVLLWYEDHVVASSAQVTGYEPGPDGNFDGLLQAHWNSKKIAPAQSTLSVL